MSGPNIQNLGPWNQWIGGWFEWLYVEGAKEQLIVMIKDLTPVEKALLGIEDEQ